MPRATAKIGRHPLHPLLVLAPIGFWLSAFLCDLVYWNTGDASFAEAALWLIGAGLVGAVFAALAGLADFAGDRAIRAISDAWHHMIGNVIAVVLALASFLLRVTEGAEAAVLPWGLALSTLIVAILLFTGWKGGELVYTHRVAVNDDAPRTRRHVEDDDRPVLH